MTYKTITKRKWEKLQDQVTDAVELIPEWKNRIRESEAEQVYRETLDHLITTIDGDLAVGRRAIYFHTENVGTRRYPHYVYRVEETTVKPNERRQNLIIIYP